MRRRQPQSCSQRRGRIYFLQCFDRAPWTAFTSRATSFSRGEAMRSTILFAFAASLALAGCEEMKRGAGPRAGSPPIEFSFRKSQIPTRGMVVGIKNASPSETLKGLTVEVRAPGEETTRSHVVEKEIKPRDSITVGWVELDGWKLKPGDEVSLTAAGYTEPKTATVPKP